MKREVVAVELGSAAAALEAAKRLTDLGVEVVDVYSPFDLPELDSILARPRPKVPVHVLLGGLTGAAGAVGLQHWCNAVDYPMLIAGRPIASWVTYVVIGFEATVLLAAFTAFASVLLGARLPRLHDPIFDLPNFERSTVDRFWITIAGKATTEVRAAVGDAVAIHEVQL